MGNVLIVGCGIVGSHLKSLFKDADILDKYKKDLTTADKDKFYDVAFIAVPTPMNDDGSCNVDEVIDAIDTIDTHYKASTICIKSTVYPTFTDKFIRSKRLKNSKLCFSPEYCGETLHSQNIDDDFLIVGGEVEACRDVARVMQSIKPGKYNIIYSDSTTAELAKYMENSFLAMKVTFANEFYRIAKQYNADYGQLRQMFICDTRVNPSHTIVYEDKPYYESKCFDKDIPAIIKHSADNGYTPELLVKMVDVNERFKAESLKE